MKYLLIAAIPSLYLLIVLAIARFSGVNGKRAEEDPVTGISPLNYPNQPVRQETPTVDLSDDDWAQQLEDHLS